MHTVPPCTRIGWITLITLAISLGLPVPGQSADQPMRHHQPTQAEIDQREQDRLGKADPATLASARKSERSEARFLSACMARIRQDEPPGLEQRHQSFCACRIDSLRSVVTAAEFDAIAANIEARVVAAPVPPMLPVNARRQNEATIDACMHELAQ